MIAIIAGLIALLLPVVQSLLIDGGPMRITFSCPNCEKSYDLPINLVGKKARCKKCSAEFVIPAPIEPDRQEPPPPLPSLDETLITPGPPPPSEPVEFAIDDDEDDDDDDEPWPDYALSPSDPPPKS